MHRSPCTVLTPRPLSFPSTPSGLGWADEKLPTLASFAVRICYAKSPSYPLSPLQGERVRVRGRQRYDTLRNCHLCGTTIFAKSSSRSLKTQQNLLYGFTLGPLPLKGARGSTLVVRRNQTNQNAPQKTRSFHQSTLTPLKGERGKETRGEGIEAAGWNGQAALAKGVASLVEASCSNASESCGHGSPIAASPSISSSMLSTSPVERQRCDGSS